MKYFVVLLIIVFIIFIVYKLKFSKKVKDPNINEWSFQRYAKFYGNTVLKDEFFEHKMNTICDLILTQSIDDIEFIAKEANCTCEECILKIRYLKNKRKIGDLYIDYVNKTLKKCSLEDQKLLDKYNSFLYKHHLQIDEIARRLPNTSIDNLDEVENNVYNDLVYLDEKGLINGIILNKVDRIIIYYHVDKHKKEKDYVTINCPNCGAINDVNKGSKVRCEYCNSIVSSDN